MLAAAGPAASATPGDKIEQSVENRLDQKGEAEFIVYFSDRADLSVASRIQDWAARGTAVADALKQTANRSQADVRASLNAAGVAYRSLWAANAIHVVSADEQLVRKIAGDGEVSAIRANHTRALPPLTPAERQAGIDAVEWGIDAISANDVWGEFGTRGEGIVVANIDTGVDYDHPALEGKYRGKTEFGFDHNYNWFDPSAVCGNPSTAPCDNNDHGTHTMGTMVGADPEGVNQIGVAPGARWIAAKGCESNNCSDAALLASGEWILAPTDLSGANPRPDLRPNIVNNSWGGGGGDMWYASIVDAWIASGIFPAFSNGNSGPGCDTAGSPGDYGQSYASGAFDINGTVASFSSRGPGIGTELKPNVAAPGVAIRSSVDGGDYAAFNGTSMASPHTAGTVALMWSAAPSLVGDIAATRELIDNTAVDTATTEPCGGSVDDNNTFGEGKLDARAAVSQSPRGPLGTVAGTVTNSSTGEPIANAGDRHRGPRRPRPDHRC